MIRSFLLSLAILALLSPLPAVPVVPRATVDLFVSVDCPIANGYAPEFNRLFDLYTPRGIKFRLVYPDKTISEQDVVEHVSKFDLKPATFRDTEGTAVERAGATVTPEAAVFDASGALVYRGKIDDLYNDFGDRRRVPSQHYLRDVLDKLLAGETVDFHETEPVGCLIEVE